MSLRFGGEQCSLEDRIVPFCMKIGRSEKCLVAGQFAYLIFSFSPKICLWVFNIHSTIINYFKPTFAKFNSFSKMVVNCFFKMQRKKNILLNRDIIMACIKYISISLLYLADICQDNCLECPQISLEPQ